MHWLNLFFTQVIRHKIYALIIFGAAMTIFLNALTIPLSEPLHTEQARSAKAFIDSIGVAVHLSYKNTAYGKYNEIIKPRLKELGIRHIRDGFKLEDLETRQKFNELAELGIKSTLVMDIRGKNFPLRAVSVAKSIPNSIEAVEGPNEWDIHPEIKYKGQNFPRGLQQFQAELYDAIKQDPATKYLPVLSPSMAHPKNAAKLGPVACDVGNMHSYAAGQKPSQKLDQKWIPNTRILCGDKPIIASECGYHNNFYLTGGHPGVPQEIAAKYLLRLYFEYFNRGIERTFTYELIDYKYNPKKQNFGLGFGLLNYDGSPKPDFLALKNLISILQEPEIDFSPSFSSNSLDFNLSGDTAKMHHTLLQKYNKNYYLVLWQEVTSFDQKTKKKKIIPEKQLTLTLNTPISKANIYQPVTSNVALQQYVNPRNLQLKVPDHPLVIELIPV